MTTGPSPTALPPVDHRQLGVDLFNHVWTLLDMKTERTPLDDEAMVHAAHASRHHWGQIGQTMHLARGEWQISRVYAVLGRSEPALHHALRSLAHCESGGAVEAFDTGFAHEAIARAHTIAGRTEESTAHEQAGRAIAAGIADAGDRDWLLENLASVPKGAWL